MMSVSIQSVVKLSPVTSFVSILFDREHGEYVFLKLASAGMDYNSVVERFL